MPRTLSAIAADITAEWGERVNYAAAPYLTALADVDTVTDTYGADTGETLVRYFLSNASSFRGENARRLKEELRSHLPTPARR